MNPPSPLVEKVERFLGRLGLGAGDMVVAVSGGPDSVALLRALLLLRSSPSPPLVIAHLNHQLRGTEGDADETFVRRLHASLVSAGHAKLHLRCERIDVASLAREAKANLEDTARKARYDWLARVALEHNLGLVATGHTADDQAETVLHRLLRGAGLQGLRGITLRRRLASGVEVVRPLLDVTRAEVLSFLNPAAYAAGSPDPAAYAAGSPDPAAYAAGSPENQFARHDSSNLDPRFTRNRIRQELLPYLAERYNPAVREVLARLARQAEEACRELEAGTEALLAEAERPRAGRVLVFDHARLAAASRYRVRALFRRVWEREGWPAGRMGFEHWRRLESLVFDDLAAVDLPGRLRARRRDRVVQIGPAP